MKSYFYILFLSPFLAVLIYNSLNIRYYGVFGAISTLYLLYFASKTPIKLRYYHVTLILLCSYYAFWAFFNGKIQEDGIVKFFFDFSSFHTLMALLIIDNYNFSASEISKFNKYIKLIIIASLTISIIQVYTPGFFIAKNLSVGIVSNISYEARRTGVFGYLDSNGLGISFIALYSIFISYQIRNKGFSNKFLWFWGSIGGLIAFLSNARYVMLVFIIVFSQVFITYGSELKLKRIFFNPKLVLSLTIISAFIGFGLNQLGYDLRAFFENRIGSSSSDSRLIAIELFKKHFPDNPIFGTGVRVTDNLYFDLAGRSSQLHVGYLSHLFEFGVIGSFLLFMFWGQILKTFYKTAKNHAFWGSFFGFLALLISNLTLVHYNIINFGLLTLFIFNRYFESRIKYT